MSVIDRKELGPHERQYKYEFTLEILKLSCEIPLPCSLKIMWKRNSRSIETKNSYDVKTGPVEIPIKEEKLSNLSTFVYNSLKKQFLAKESELVVNMYFNGSPKKLASCPIDTRCVLDPVNLRTGKSQIFEVSLTPSIRNSGPCKLTYRLSSVFKQEVLETERYSAGLNTSGYSTQHPYERKYEVPSKDNISVASYNPSSRYSANKRDRDDSSSRRHQYGLIGGLKSNLSNQQTGNDFDTKSNMKSMDNEANLNRILNEEQKKRSKLESELSKQQVELGQLKKKISQLAIENMNLKQELKKVEGVKDTKDTCDKEQLNALQFKLYEANNQLRETRSQLQNRKRQTERLEGECMRMRMERSNFQQQVSIRQNKIEQLQRNTASAKAAESLRGENGQLRYQVESLRRYVDEVRQQANDKQNQIISQNYRERQQLTGKLQQLQRQNERLKGSGDILQELQRKVSSIQEELSRTRGELTNRTRVLQQTQQQADRLRSMVRDFEMERSFGQKQLSRVRETEGQLEWLRTQNNRLKQEAKFYQEQHQEGQQQMQRMKLEQSQHQSRNNKLLPQINDLQKRLNDAQVEINVMKAENRQLKELKDAAEGEVNHLRQEMFRSAASASTNPEMDRLLRESLQMQVELKFAKDQLDRLRGLEQTLEGERWRADKEHKERVEMEGQFEQTQKELVKKNRALLIECEKAKVLAEQIEEQRAAAALYKQELEQQENTFGHLQTQLQQTRAHNEHMAHDLANMQQHVSSLEMELQKAGSARDEILRIQNSYQQLQRTFNDKNEALVRANRNIETLGEELVQLRSRNEELHRELVGRDKERYDLDAKMKEMEKQRGVWEGERGRLVQDRKMLEKKNEMVMEQIHTMKKKFQEEKGRSVSYVRSEDSHRVRVLQSDLEKREKAISKLNKEKLELEQENVKINVQVMKLLSEVERLKANGLSGTTSSFKSLGAYK